MAHTSEPHLDSTQRLLAEALKLHGVPQRTAIRLAGQFSESHLLQQLCYVNYEWGRKPEDPSDWRWLVARIRHDWPAPPGYPFDHLS
jgi:hypothetical protein